MSERVTSTIDPARSLSRATSTRIFPSDTLEQPGDTLPAEPDQLRRALELTLEVLSYDGGTTLAEVLAAGDRLRPAQLQPEPLRAADHDRDRLRLRARRRPRRSAAAEPHRTLAVGDRGATVTLPRASRSTPTPPTARPPAPTRKRASARRKKPSAPSSPRSAPEIESSALPGPLPGYVYLGQAAARRSLPDLPGRQRLCDPRQARRHGHPRPADRPAHDHLRRPPQSPFTAFNMHFFGSERGLLATPTQCGTYPVPSTFAPWDSSLPPRPRPSSSRSTRAPTARPAQAPPAPSAPTSRPPRRQHRRRPQPLHHRPHARRRRPEPDRPRRHHAARLLRDAGGHPLLP